MLAFHLATFKVDATPPIGHPLCGGWIKPVVGVTDPLWLRGIVLEGGGLPIVLAALDWTGLCNESYRLFSEAIAEAAHTTADRVALHCVHQHNAPFVDGGANAILREAGAKTRVFDPDFVADLATRASATIRQCLEKSRPISQVAFGRAGVKEVACNRRVIGEDGKIRYTRYSATIDPAARAAPEGTVDPDLTSIGFFQGDRPLARIYNYAVHPMSYYGDGLVTSDFVGLARERRDREEDCLHVYFTGPAGNVTAGKYNDGSPSQRPVLAERIHAAMVEADAKARETAAPIDHLAWTTADFRFSAREDLNLDRLLAIVADEKKPTVERHRSAMAASTLRRLEKGTPVRLGSLDLGGFSWLSLPAETFVEYGIEARRLAGDRPLAVAAYGDGGPWYIPLEKSFDEGGYEPSVAWTSRRTEPSYRRVIADLVGKSKA